MPNSAVKTIAVHQLAIPMRRLVTHASATRRVSESVVVAVELNSGAVGYGETLPRSYVTSESVDSVVEAVVYQPEPKNIHTGSVEWWNSIVATLPDFKAKNTGVALAQEEDDEIDDF